MRELRKDIESTLESPKEELENMDEMKIEDVIMGLKGLKQEEVFSFLGKNNFTPSETEISSAGLGSYDQLASVDTSEMEQLQLSFNAHFDGLQGIQSHTMQPNMFHVSKFGHAERPKIKNEPNTSKTFIDSSKTLLEDASHGWPTIKKEKLDDLQPQHLSSLWPRYPASHQYSLADCPVENLREEEIVATNIAEEMISSTSMDEEEFKYTPPNNTYVIQPSADGASGVDKPKPIKLLIKRVESEDEVIDSPVTRMRSSKRTRQPSVKHKPDETSAPPKKKRCPKRTPNKTKRKSEVMPTSKPKEELFDELDFPFSNTVHQDDDFVYPSLDLSDDEDDDVYIFSQRDDTTWTPKNKMKINDVKTERPTRDRKRNSAVAKCLEAAALKRADSAPTSAADQRKCVRKSPRKKSLSSARKSRSSSNESFNNLVIVDSNSCALDSLPTSDVSLPDSTYLLPSTSAAVYSTPSSSYCTLNTFSTLTSSSFSCELPVPKASTTRRIIKTKSRTPVKTSGARIIPPKTCKLIQTPSSAKLSATNLLLSAVKGRCMKDEVTSSSSTSSCSTPCSAEKKSPGASYVTKRGKPKKGMATAKQRLGKILKMHKMFF